MELKTGKDNKAFSDFVLILIKLKIFEVKSLTWRNMKKHSTYSYARINSYPRVICTQWEWSGRHVGLY